MILEKEVKREIGC